jgi:transcription elongation factor GreA
MSYLEDIQKQINYRDFNKFLILWEEYASADQADVQEFISILQSLKNSDFSKQFGQMIQTAIPLWKTIEDKEHSYLVLKELIDLQSTNDLSFAEIATEALQHKFQGEKHFQDFLRLSGLKNKIDFQGALSHFELLTHLKKGNFVYHSAGWGTGEIMDVSLLRETASIEFENVAGLKHITFANAFKTLTPLAKNHFLAQRFSDPDAFEKFARKEPGDIVKLLLKDLGSKTSGEIKDELVDLVIPESDWNKWWQQAKTRLKKDTMVQTPDRLQDPFVLRKQEVSHSQDLFAQLDKANHPATFMQVAYTNVRDIPSLLKEEGCYEKLKEKLVTLLDEKLTSGHKLQLMIFLDTFFPNVLDQKSLFSFIQELTTVEKVVDQMDILAFKKRAMILIKQCREDWKEIFFSSLFSIDQNLIREYLVEELNKKETHDLLVKKLKNLMIHPEKSPEFFFWYFQKITQDVNKLPFGDKEGQSLLLEHYLILLNKIELDPEFKELTKKMVTFLCNKRYKQLRDLIEGTDIDFIKEFLLLVSKCHSFTNNDKKNIQSLAEVVQPTLASKKKEEPLNHVVWTTEEGYKKTHSRIEHISTVEMLENAKEVEKARSYGDLRENSEYKYACERRHQLQSELRSLSGMLNHARIITKDDVNGEQVGIGNIVALSTPKGEKVTYTILGPWDSDTDKNIISIQSKMAQAMLGKKVGEAFTFRDETYKVVSIGSFL